MSCFRNILVVVDSSAEQETPHLELERALKLVDQTPEAKLHLVDVVKDEGFAVRFLSKDYGHIHQLLVKEKQEAIDALIEHCKAHGIQASGEVLQGQSSVVTAKTAQTIHADLIVRAAKGRHSLERGPLGTSSQKLIRALPCAIWLTHAEHEPQANTIVAAVNATPGDSAHAELNDHILKTALELAKHDRSKLLVVYAWNLHGSEMLRHRLPQSEFQILLEHNRKQHFEGFENLLSKFDLHAASPTSKMIEGEPSFSISQFCNTEKVDLLVCGTIARHGISGLLLGNTAERIINHCECSVLALPPPRR
ncbi:MAG: universal stress protein [Pirellulaceae bacterium]